MKNAIKSYLVFTTGLCRVVTFVLVPLLAVAVQWLIRPQNFMTASILNALVLVSAELMLDYWVFGGIAVKNVKQMEYLKTSPKGRRIMRMALIADMVRQFLAGVVLFAFGIAFCLCRGSVTSWESGRLAEGIAVLLFAYALTVTGITIARHFDGMAANMMIAMAAYVILTAGIFLILDATYVMLAVSLALSVAASIFGVWKVMKRVEEGYYDQTDEA